MAEPKQQSRPKQVVYLWGAGATQAEVDYLGAYPINLLMRDSNVGEGVSTRVLKRAYDGREVFLVVDKGVDIEKLISLLSASGVDKHAILAERIRQDYFEEIRASLVLAGVHENPQLITGLLELHANKEFAQQVEQLTAIITTNHDGLVQIASQNVFGGVNVGFPYSEGDFSFPAERPIPPVLQLHGSFTWRFAVPISVAKLKKDTTYSPATIWIPPSILKEAKQYPFNKLTALAYEFLLRQCDVLRIVGSSLTQNDWNVLSLIFHAQRHRELLQETAFRIELIMPPQSGEAIKADCSYLTNVASIGYLDDGDFSPYNEDGPLPIPDMQNPLAYWLKEKISYHVKKQHIKEHELGKAMTTITGA